MQLTAPNGRTYIQPTGLFINNEWVRSSEGLTITSINPTYVEISVDESFESLHGIPAMRRKSPPSRPLLLLTSIAPSKRLGRPSMTHHGGSFQLQIVGNSCSS